MTRLSLNLTFKILNKRTTINRKELMNWSVLLVFRIYNSIRIKTIGWEKYL